MNQQNPEEKKTVTEDKEAPPVDTSSMSLVTKKVRFFLLLASLAIFMAFVALVAVAMIWNILAEQENQIRIFTSKLRPIFTENSMHIALLNSSLKQLQNRFAKEQQHIKKLTFSTNQLLLHTRQNNEWELLKTVHLLELANLSLRFVEDQATALTLLKLADEQLGAMTNPTTLNLRQAIGKNILELQNNKGIDRAGLLIKLNVINDKIPSLPLATPHHPPVKKPSSTNPPLSFTNWQSFITNISQKLQEIVIIRKSNQPLNPVMSVSKQQKLTAKIQLLLQEALFGETRHCIKTPSVKRNKIFGNIMI
jgi:uroporphyrin-III C-methyltransferase